MLPRADACAPFPLLPAIITAISRLPLLRLFILMEEMCRARHMCDCISIILQLIVPSIASIMAMLRLYKWSFSGCALCRCRTRCSGCFCLYFCLLVKCLLTAAGTSSSRVIRKNAGAFELLSLLHWGAVWEMMLKKHKTERAISDTNP